MSNSKTEKFKKKIAKLSICEKLGQLLILDFRYWEVNSKNKPIPFTKINDTVANIIEKYNLGGIALFRENIETPEQIVTLIREMQNAASIPLIIGTDQEGGIVTRLQSGTDMPGNMALGAVNDTTLTKMVAKTIGSELNALGINLNFAPVIDVNSNPKNPIIGVRSFSSSPKIVSKHGTAYIEGLNTAKILSCAKHFPGHGNTNTDTHLKLATITYSKQKIFDTDIIPFHSAIAAKCDTIMAGHVIIPALDNTKIISTKNNREIGIPATLSKKILTNLLRIKLKYDGVIITDAMDMKAILNNFEADDATIMAIHAGIDMLVMPVKIWKEKDIYKLKNLIRCMKKEYETNINFRNRVEESLLRIFHLKEKYNLLSMLKNKNKLIENANCIVGCAEHIKIEKTVASQAITMLKNNNRNLPFIINNNSKILLIDSNNSRMNIFKNEFIQICNKLELNAKISTYKTDYDTSLTEELKDKISSSELVVILTYNLKNEDILPENISKFTEKSKIKSAIVACRNPYDILKIPSCKSYIAIYGAIGFDQTNYKLASLKINIRASVRTMFFSEINPNLFNSPKGKLPVDISQKYPLNYGLTYQNNS
jgi:beta-N-acetylhexosaminidase